MESKRRDNPLFYADPDDPRLYLYKHPRWKGLGVTLNFSHPRAWRVLWITLAACLIPLLLVHAGFIIAGLMLGISDEEAKVWFESLASNNN